MRERCCLQIARGIWSGDNRGIKIVICAARPGRAGVVYAGSRDSTEKLAEKLIAEGIPALA